MMKMTCFKFSIALSLALSLSACKNTADRQTPADSNAQSANASQTAENNSDKADSDLAGSLKDVVSAHEKMKDLGPASDDEIKAVRATFNEFKDQVLSYHGPQAASLLAKSTIEYYKLLLSIARIKLHSPGKYKEVEENLSATLSANVALIAERLSPEFIDNATPEKLYEVAFSQGWIGYNSFKTGSIDNIHAYDNEGTRYLTGDFYYAGTLKDKRVMRMGFVFENNAWRVDLMPIFIDLDQTVERFLFKEDLDRESTLQESLKATKDNLDPKNWKPSIQKKDEFSVNFPRDPLYAEDNNERIYTSQDYRFGQFDVRVLYYPESPESPLQYKPARDLDLRNFLSVLQADSPKCTMHMLNSDVMIQCDFTVPAHNSRGKAVWVYTKNRRYLLFNLAREDQYSDETAALYMQSFSYGLAQ